jgi:hypothetical protein
MYTNRSKKDKQSLEDRLGRWTQKCDQAPSKPMHARRPCIALPDGFAKLSKLTATVASLPCICAVEGGEVVEE